MSTAREILDSIRSFYESPDYISALRNNITNYYTGDYAIMSIEDRASQKNISKSLKRQINTSYRDLDMPLNPISKGVLKQMAHQRFEARAYAKNIIPFNLIDYSKKHL